LFHDRLRAAVAAGARARAQWSARPDRGGRRGDRRRSRGRRRMRAAMTPLIAKILWGLGCVGWDAIPHPPQRPPPRTPGAGRRGRLRDPILMPISFTGLFAIPFAYALTDQPKFAAYPFQPPQAWLGVVVLLAAMALFYRTHRDLGGAWSVTLEIRQAH